jgi:ubiquinone/menaquinone biosynthesis C-methylase UbiE
MSTSPGWRHWEHGMPKPVRIWDFFAKRYAKQPIADEASYQEKLKLTQAYLRPDSEVVEFGCGTGSTAMVHAPRVKHILATDLSSKMLEIARTRADAQGITNITFRQVAVEDLEVPRESKDVVMAHNILHLLEDKEAAIAKAFAVLRPGGVFVTSTVCLSESAKGFRLVAPLARFLGVLVHFFTAEELEAAFVAAGFEIHHSYRPDLTKALFLVGKKPD